MREFENLKMLTSLVIFKFENFQIN
jgi:hypothetical protein